MVVRQIVLPENWSTIPPARRLTEIDAMVMRLAPMEPGIWKQLMNLYDRTEKESRVVDEIIEAMCRAAYAVDEPGETVLMPPPWDDLPEGSRDWWRARMRAAHEALLAIT